MAASNTKLLNLIATLLLATTAVTCVSLGRWQLSRAQERQNIAAVIEQGRSGSPVDLNAMPSADQLQPWRPAQVEGVWQPQFNLLLDNRNLDGKPGLWLATPLLLADGHAVLVLRGWFARPIGMQEAPVIPTPQGIQHIKGELSLHVPRLFELWGAREQSGSTLPTNWPGTGMTANPGIVSSQDMSTLPRLQNIAIEDLSKRLGIKFLPVVLMQKDEQNDGLKRVWPEPSVDSDKNIGYAMQWFGFAAIAVIAWLGFAWRIWRRKKTA
jgi:cytochrome oxidase assembly protein ShyY1